MNRSRNIRIQRYESRIAKELNKFIQKEVYNSTLKFAKIMYVKLSKDYTSLKVYVDCLEHDKIESLVKKLNISNKIFKAFLAQNFNFKKIPEITFYKDETMDRVKEIELIFENLKK